jgi:protein gp37
VTQPKRRSRYVTTIRHSLMSWGEIMFDKAPTGQYWDKSWNPIKLKGGGYGCTKVSPGCRSCWAESYSRRFFKTPPYDGRKREFYLDEKVLTAPLRARKPRVYFVCDLMDLFHEDVPGRFIYRVFAQMELCSHHIFLVLTKRAKRTVYFLDGWSMPPNVFLGITAENQELFNERWRYARQIPASVIWVSYEPALGSLILPDDFLERGKRVWVVCGGETRAKARAMHPEWPRKLRDDCQAAGVNFLFKQWGKWVPSVFTDKAGDLCAPSPDEKIKEIRIENDPETWMTSHPEWQKQAGRLLDGREWNNVPEVK